jgi:hypothetical protein
MATEAKQPWGPVIAPVDFDALSNYMAQNVPKFKGPFVTTGQFGIGMSNPTYYLVDQTGERYVVRRKPGGKLAFGAWEMKKNAVATPQNCQSLIKILLFRLLSLLFSVLACFGPPLGLWYANRSPPD